MSSSKAWLDINIGDSGLYAKHKAAYDSTDALLQKNYAIYGLPSSLAELSEEQQDILKELDVYRPYLTGPPDRPL
jgi:hypothetical protein